MFCDHERFGCVVVAYATLGYAPPGAFGGYAPPRPARPAAGYAPPRPQALSGATRPAAGYAPPRPQALSGATRPRAPRQGPPPAPAPRRRGFAPDPVFWHVTCASPGAHALGRRSTGSSCLRHDRSASRTGTAPNLPEGSEGNRPGSLHRGHGAPRPGAHALGRRSTGISCLRHDRSASRTGTAPNLPEGSEGNRPGSLHRGHGATRPVRADRCIRPDQGHGATRPGASPRDSDHQNAPKDQQRPGHAQRAKAFA
jgi:translation initiation factor IF-2